MSIRRIAGEQKGATVTIVAVVLVVLLGFAALVVDVGVLFEHRRQLQNAVDAAALAGAQQIVINKSQATGQAYAYAASNGVPSSEVVEATLVSIYNPDDGVKVKARRKANTLFAPVLGSNFEYAEAQATAILTQLEVGPLWPWGVTQSSLEAGTVDLKVGAQNSMNGNFMALDFPGSSGGKDYNNWIENGYQGWVPSGVSEDNPWHVDTETGNLVGPTLDGVNYLLNEPYSGLFNDIRNPRVGLVPILADNTWDTIRGKEEVEIIGFAIFYLDGVYDTGQQANGQGGGSPGQAAVTGNFLSWAYGVGNTKKPGGPLEGLIGARLIE